MKLLIAIPAYNEEQMIGDILKQFPKKLNGIDKVDILVVDDGSIDNTIKIVRQAGIDVINHFLNRGLGGALKTIFATAKLYDYDILITFDADGQHDVADLQKLVNPILKNRTDVVIGTRWKLTQKAPLSRYLINQFANMMTFFFFGVWTSDSQSGLRAFNKKAIKLIDLKTDGMEVSSEIFKEIYNKKLAFVEIPIRAIYTSYSKLKGQRLTNAPNILIELLLRFLR